MSATAPDPAFLAGLAMGPSLIGTALTYLLTGCMITQTYFYMITYRNDPKWIKIYVVFLLIADIVNSVFDLCWVYDRLITHFGDVSAIVSGTWLVAADPALVAILATSVQLFFAWRIKVLTHNAWLTAFVAATSIVGGLGGMGVAAAVHWVPLFADFYKFNQTAIVWLVASAACDVMITTVLTVHLRRQKTGFGATDSVLKKITRLTIQNSAITTIWCLINLGLFLFSHTGLYLIFNFSLGKLYTNTLMSTLNARDGWKFGKSGTTSEGVAAQEYAAKKTTTQDIVNLPVESQASQGVFIHVESHEMVDIDVDHKGNDGWSSRSDAKHTGLDSV